MFSLQCILISRDKRISKPLRIYPWLTIHCLSISYLPLFCCKRNVHCNCFSYVFTLVKWMTERIEHHLSLLLQRFLSLWIPMIPQWRYCSWHNDLHNWISHRMQFLFAITSNHTVKISVCIVNFAAQFRCCWFCFNDNLSFLVLLTRWKVHGCFLFWLNSAQERKKR